MADRATRIVPEAGIEVSESRPAELENGCERLDALVSDLAGDPLLPDVIVFYNAVRYALDQDLFYDEEDVDHAARQLEHGVERAERLATGEAPWTTQTGLVVRGYRSRLDDSVQPYGMVVPDSLDPAADRAHRLDIWHHGRNAKLSELRFLVERQTDPGRFTPDDTFVLHTYGRYCNAMKFAGEVDTFEALDHARGQYPVDDDRVSMRGFSMGGAATWHLATHYADRWVAATPGAGFAETAVYQNIAAREVQPPAWERTLWAMYDATKWAGNLRHCPTIAYSGENDKQMQAADIMVEHAASEGVEVPHVIGKGMGHAYDDASKEAIEDWLAPIVRAGKDRAPRQIRFTTWTLKYDRMHWVRVEALDRHWVRAQVDADVEGDHVDVRTRNVTALSLEMSRDATVFDPGTSPVVTIDGDELATEQVDASGGWRVYLVRGEGGWLVDAPDESVRKRHGLQGPIDDAFMDSFLMVTPSGSPGVAASVAEWIEREQADAVYQWKMQFRGDPRVRVDRDVSEADIAAHHLVLWGDPKSNRLTERVIADLPLAWTADAITLGERRWSGEPYAPVMVYPNPLNPERYVVLNSGFTFAPNGSQSNSTQTPKLPDWAILDTRFPPNERPLKGVVECGFFGERWEVVSS